MGTCHASRATVLLALLAAFAGTVLATDGAPEAVGEAVRVLTALNKQLEVLGNTMVAAEGQSVVGAGGHMGRSLVARVAKKGLVCPKKGCSRCPFGVGVCGSIVCCVKEANRLGCTGFNQLRSICQRSPVKLSRARCKPVRDGLASIKRLTGAVPTGLLSFCSGLSAQFKFLVQLSAQLSALQKVCCR